MQSLPPLGEERKDGRNGFLFSGRNSNQACCSANQIFADSLISWSSESVLETCAFLPRLISKKFSLAMINLHEAEMVLAPSVR